METGPTEIAWLGAASEESSSDKDAIEQWRRQR